MKDHHILITGASGFVGTALTKHLLDEGASVTTLLARWEPESCFVASGLIYQTNNVIGSIEDYDTVQQAIAEYNIDTVIHLAAVSIEGQSFQSPRQAFDINIRGTYNLLEACRSQAHLVKRIIVASSDKAYGDSPTLPYSEEMALLGRHPYDVSKVCGDLIAQSYYHIYRLPVVIGRFGNIIGGGDLNCSRLVPGTIRRLMRGEQPVIRMHPLGGFARDFLYIKDVVSAYMSLLTAFHRPEIHGQAFNFAMGGCWTVPEVVQEIQRLLCKTDVVPIVVPATHGEIRHQQMSNEKARCLLNWTPTYALTTSLAETVEWYVKFLEGVLPSMP
jgi:CDP-glucose 4,6-dehydratase